MADNLYFDFDIDSSQLERLRQAIEVSGTSKSFDTQLKISIGSILKRVRSGMNTTASEEAANVYNITEKIFKTYTKVKNVKTSSGENGLDTVEYVAELTFSGNKIPLVKFDALSSYHKRKEKIIDVVQKSIHRGEPKTVFRHAFYARSPLSGRIGVYARKDKSRLPLTELMGPSGAQMIDDDDITDKIAEKAAVTFENRLDHEIERIMNGWGV